MDSDRLIRLARSGSRLTPVWLVALLSLVFFVLPAALVGGALAPALTPPLFGSEAELNASAVRSGLAFTVSELAAYVLVVLLVGAWVYLYERRSLATLGLRRAGAARQLGVGAGLGLAAFTLWFAVAVATGAVVPETGLPGTVGVRALGGVLIASVGVLIAAAAEEVLFRGWALPVVGARLGPALGVLLSSALFALPHALNDDVTLLAMLNIGLYGAVLALWALMQGSIWGAVGFHWFWNLAQFNLYGFDVTPETTLGGALLNYAYTANVPFVTAGLVAEDGLLLTLSLLAATVALYLRLVRRPVASAPST